MIVSAAAYFIYIALILLAAFLREGSLWSVGWWSFMSPPLAVILSIFSMSAFFRGRPVTVDKKSEPPYQKKLASYITVAFSAALLLWLFRNDHPVYGSLPEDAELIRQWLFLSSGHPIPQIINQLLFRFLNSAFLASAVSTLMIVGILAGICYSAAAWSFSRSTRSKNGTARVLSFLLLVSGGYFAVFFGEGFVTLGVLFCFLHLISMERYAGQRGSLAFPAVTIYLALFSHPAAIYLLPGFIWAIWTGLKSGERRSDTLKTVSLFIPLWICAEILLTLAPQGNSIVQRTFPLFSGLTAGAGFSQQILNFTNNMLLTGPAALAATLFLAAGSILRPAGKAFGRDEAHPASGNTRYLAISAVSAIVMIALANNYSEKGLMWTVLCVSGPVFALYTLRKLENLKPRRFFISAALLCAAGFIQLAGIVITNSSPERSRERLMSLRIPKGRAEFIIAETAMGNQMRETAMDYYTRAVQKDPSNHEAFFALGRIHLDKRNFYKAVSNLSRASDLRPGNQEYRFVLVMAYMEAKWYRDAIPHLRKLVEESADNSEYWTKLGSALGMSGEFLESMEAYERALELDPENDDYRNNLATATINRAIELIKEGQDGRAERLLLRAIPLNPRRSEGYSNLAALEMHSGNYNKALEILEKALRISTRIDFQTYLNLGLVHEKLGNYREALKYLRMSRKINPMSAADRHIRRIGKKLESREKPEGK